MQSLSPWLRKFFLQRKGIYAKPATRRAALGIFFFTSFMILLSADITSDKVDVKEGDVSDRDIVALRTVSYIDAVKTKKLEDEVVKSVADVYDLDVTASAHADNALKQLEASLANLQKKASASQENDAPPQDAALELEKMKSGVAQENEALQLTEDNVSLLVQMKPGDFAALKDRALVLLHRSLQRGVQEDEVVITKKHIAIEVADMGLPPAEEKLVNTLVDRLLVSNMVLNTKETDKRRQAAAASVEPVRESIRKGQVIVRRGDIVTAQQIAMMGELGLYKGKVNYLRLVGLAVYVAVTMAFVMAFLYKFDYKTYRNDLLLLLIGLVTLFALLMGKLAYAYSYFAAPLATGALLGAILVNTRVGMILSVALAVLFAVIANYDLRAVLAAVLGGIGGVYSVAKMAHGYSLTKTGIWISAIHFIVIGSVGFLVDIELAQLLFECLLGVLGGIAAAVITTGILPYLEHAFNITTPIKLLELGQSNHPLLQRLLLEAPGTYHHSVILGNLAEAAADVIGADPVTVRVGAYYHDVGKIKRAYFFVENQFGGENPHDKLAPGLSALIVTSHVKDGVELCREYNIPKVIIDIVEQHHGTMLASFFYRKAVEAEHGECVKKEDFCYSGPKPQTKEAALIMVADACEAAVRSIGKPNRSRVDAMVRKIIRERLNEGQFDECNLTLRDLTEIGDVYTRILSSMFHSRIEYPESIKEIEGKNKQNGNSVRELPAGAVREIGSGGNGEKSN